MLGAKMPTKTEFEAEMRADNIRGEAENAREDEIRRHLAKTILGRSRKCPRRRNSKPKCAKREKCPRRQNSKTAIGEDDAGGDDDAQGEAEFDTEMREDDIQGKAENARDKDEVRSRQGTFSELSLLHFARGTLKLTNRLAGQVAMDIVKSRSVEKGR